MKNPLGISWLDKIYSSIFSLVLLGILLSFLPWPVLPLSNISDHFRWQNRLIETYATTRFKLGDRVYPDAVVGTDGWVFYTGNNSMTDYQIAHPPRKKMLSDLQKKLDRLSKDLKEQGITLVVAIVPNKSTIYPQYMPNEISLIGERSDLDQFVEYMNLSGKTPVVDLRTVLLEKSRTQDVYYKTDTHWNDLGAYYGYVEIMRSLASFDPKLQFHPLSDFEYQSAGTSTRDLSRIMGLLGQTEENQVLVPKFNVNLTEVSDKLPEEALYIRTVTNTNRDLPSLLVFHDSFYISLAHFLEPHFRRVKTIPFTEKDDSWSLTWIQKEYPDIVLIEFVERYLDDSLAILLDSKTDLP